MIGIEAYTEGLRSRFVFFPVPLFALLYFVASFPLIMDTDQGRPLPKFGEWDVNNPASAEGFTVIFNKARDEKKTGGNSGAATTPSRNEGLHPDVTDQHPSKTRKWFCCG